MSSRNGKSRPVKRHLKNTAIRKRPSGKCLHSSTMLCTVNVGFFRIQIVAFKILHSIFTFLKSRGYSFHTYYTKILEFYLTKQNINIFKKNIECF